jgi:hypothetical protein
MQIILTTEEKRTLFEDSIQYLGQSLRDWEFEIDFEQEDYNKAKEQLKEREGNYQFTYDLIFTEMLFAGFKLKFIDQEDENNIVVFDLEQFEKNLSLVNPIDIMLIVNEGDYDYYVCDRVVQILIFGDVVYC